MMHTMLSDPGLMNPAFEFNPESLFNFSNHQKFGKEINHGETLQTPDLVDRTSPSVDLNESVISSDSLQVPDFSDACLKFISDILLEEDLDESPASVQEYKALQATEKSLYDALGEEYSLPSDCFPSHLDQNIVTPDGVFDGNCCKTHGVEVLDQNIETPDDVFDGNCCKTHGVEDYARIDTPLESNYVLNQTVLKPFLTFDDLSHSLLELKSPSSSSSNSFDDFGGGLETSPVSTLPSKVVEKGDKLVNRSRRKKNHQRDDGGYEGRTNKFQASYSEDYVEMKEYDDVLLCREDKHDIAICSRESLPNEASEKSHKKGSKGRTTRDKKKKNNEAEEVDLRTLLSHCAQAVLSFDLKSANKILKQIRQHSSPYGDSIQRLSHYFANGLEARLAGTGSTVSSNIVDARISSSNFLKAYKLYVSAVPFKRMSFFLANNTILKLVENATKIHIIDFGILLGLQWPCFIQNLSKRPNGPPKLRITGIDYPQQGFRPAEMVEATGRRLSGYCERFNVPFEYHAIAKKWESILSEDLKIEKDEMVIVNCMFRSGTLLDETVEENSPRDAFLGLIKLLNPDLFIHGVINGTFNAPFFISRFKEALFHYSSIFDVFEATMPHEDHERLLIESEVFGKEALNVIACEGVERVQRPETYKQWQVRTSRTGLRQLPLEKEFLSRAKSMVKANYHKDFVVDEDRHWMLQGWKGRTFCALSFWQP